MELIQINESQLKKIMLEVDEPKESAFAEGSIPPLHVLVRSIDLLSHAVEVIWALPYFIHNGAQIVGCCGFKSAPQNGRVEIGYHVAASAQGLGVATFAVRELSHIAFDSKQVSNVVALIALDNQASLSVVNKNGFSYQRMVVDEEGGPLGCWELNKG